MRAFSKDILRTIGGSKKRYLSIVAICALGATMLTGLSIACLDLRESAEALYERQHLYDISVQSTLGLTQDDVDELAGTEGVAVAEGGYEIETYTEVDGIRSTVMLKTLLSSGINEPYVVEGSLPDAPNEIAVTENYLHTANKSIGDTVTFEDAVAEDPTGLFDLNTSADTGSEAGSGESDDEQSSADDPLIPGGTYTIVGAVIDPTNITQPEGPIAFRASTSSDYTFFVDESAVADTSSYTVVYLTASGTEGLSSYSSEYEARVDEVQSRVEDLAPQRERARTEEIKSEALDEIAVSEADARRQLADAEQELIDGQATIDESLADALAGQQELDTQRANALSELNDAQATIDEQRAAALDGIEQAREGLATIDQTRSELNGQLDSLDALADAKYQAEAGAAEAKQRGDELVSRLSNDQIAASAELAATWNTLSSWTGTEEPVSEEQAFINAVDAYASEVSQLLSLARLGQQIMEAQYAPELARRTEIDERLQEIAARAGEISDRQAAIDERLAQIEAELASLPDGDVQRTELLDEQTTLQEEQQTLSAEQEALANEQTTITQERAVITEALVLSYGDITIHYDDLASVIAQLEQAQEQLQQLTAGGEESAVAQLAQGMGQAASGLAQVNAAIAQIDGGLEGARTQINAGLEALDAAERDARAGLATAQNGLELLDAAQSELATQRASALAQLADAQQTIDEGLSQLADAQAELDEGRATFETERADALQQIADARAQVDEVESATWYVQDRSALGSFSSVDSDASSIEAIARIIPVIFFVVAILVSLTTATRMVEEERGLVGLYKALGYSNARILSKYLIYTGSAALIGGIIGDIAGFVVIPYVLFYIFQAMYLLPLFSLHFDLFYAVLGIVAFVAGIAGATFITCRKDLTESPASLMRPRAPRAGSRIFLEHIRPLWRRLGFLNKVTARNLFRYKKRLAMTIFGIMGCTALLICGFSIKNTVESLAPRQYEQIYRYDLMAVTSADDFEAARSMLEGVDEVTDLEAIGVDTITVEYGGGKESMQLYVIPSGMQISDYVSLQTLEGGPISLDDTGVVMTNNAATVLGLSAGDTASITTSALNKAEVTVESITRNYLGNAIYMTEDAYEELFGPLELNGFFAHLTGGDTEQREFADELEGDDIFLSITSVAKMREQFEQSFTLINVVVYVVIGLAAGLAFVVLFTLSTVNIGEREREIATIKVLGFRAGEVRTYINKETLVLTGLGILVGLPAGWALSESFTYILKMPSIFFDVVVDPWCYALAAAFSIVFALAVSLITNRMLARIDMVEALKSPE